MVLNQAWAWFVAVVDVAVVVVTILSDLLSDLLAESPVVLSFSSPSQHDSYSIPF